MEVQVVDRSCVFHHDRFVFDELVSEMRKAKLISREHAKFLAMTVCTCRKKAMTMYRQPISREQILGAADHMIDSTNPVHATLSGIARSLLVSAALAARLSCNNFCKSHHLPTSQARLTVVISQVLRGEVTLLWEEKSWRMSSKGKDAMKILSSEKFIPMSSGRIDVSHPSSCEAHILPRHQKGDDKRVTEHSPHLCPISRRGRKIKTNFIIQKQIDKKNLVIPKGIHVNQMEIDEKDPENQKEINETDFVTQKGIEGKNLKPQKEIIDEKDPLTQNKINEKDPLTQKGIYEKDLVILNEIDKEDLVTQKEIDEKDLMTHMEIDERDLVTQNEIDEKDLVTQKEIDEKDLVTQLKIDGKDLVTEMKIDEKDLVTQRRIEEKYVPEKEIDKKDLLTQKEIDDKDLVTEKRIEDKNLENEKEFDETVIQMEIDKKDFFIPFGIDEKDLITQKGFNRIDLVTQKEIYEKDVMTQMENDEKDLVTQNVMEEKSLISQKGFNKNNHMTQNQNEIEVRSAVTQNGSKSTENKPLRKKKSKKKRLTLRQKKKLFFPLQGLFLDVPLFMGFTCQLFHDPQVGINFSQLCRQYNCILEVVPYEFMLTRGAEIKAFDVPSLTEVAMWCRCWQDYYDVYKVLKSVAYSIMDRWNANRQFPLCSSCEPEKCQYFWYNEIVQEHYTDETIAEVTGYKDSLSVELERKTHKQKKRENNIRKAAERAKRSQKVVGRCSNCLLTCTTFNGLEGLEDEEEEEDCRHHPGYVKENKWTCCNMVADSPHPVHEDHTQSGCQLTFHRWKPHKKASRGMGAKRFSTARVGEIIWPRCSRTMRPRGLERLWFDGFL